MTEVFELIRTYFVEFLAVTGISATTLTATVVAIKTFFGNKSLKKIVAEKVQEYTPQVKEYLGNFVKEQVDTLKENFDKEMTNAVNGLKNELNKFLGENAMVDLQAYIIALRSNNVDFDLQIEQVKTQLLEKGKKELGKIVQANKENINQVIEIADNVAVASLNTVKTELITKSEQLAEQGQTAVKTAKKKIKKVVETVDDYA